MGSIAEHAALLVLLRRAGNWSDVADRVDEHGSARAALTEAAAATLFDPDVDEELAVASADLAVWAAEGMSFCAVTDRSYPARLRMVHQRPPFLMFRGDIAAADGRAIAVVGSREASEEGMADAADLARMLVAREVTVVSGLALGIDTTAHRATVAAAGRTVAVVGTGLRRVYPGVNRDLQDAVVEHGAVLSQFWPDAPPTKTSFPMRNAVMSGLVGATVVVEAGEHSGARVQARLALQHGRQVFLHRRVLANEWARRAADRPGAAVFSSPEEIAQRVEEILDPGEELVFS